MSKFMRGGAPRTKTQTPSVQTSLDIQGQGTVPYAKTVSVPVPPSPKKGFTSTGSRAGEQTVRGYGLQLRATKFVLR